MPKQHCESCGDTNPIDNGEGYTACCNELFCDGRDRNKFGTPDKYVVACCWAIAEELFKANGEKIPDGSCRLD